MSSALVFISVYVLLIVISKWQGQKLLEIFRAEASPALAIAINSAKSLLLFICVFAFLYAVKTEFDTPTIFTPERMNYFSK